MNKSQWITLGAALTVTVFFSIFWHVVLFEQAYLDLGVYTRMNHPNYGYGMLAWLMESAGFILVYFQTNWSRQGIVGALKFSWLMGIFLTASVLVGVAAKVELSNVSLWFLLTGGFYGIYFTLMGVVVGSIYKPRKQSVGG